MTSHYLLHLQDQNPCRRSYHYSEFKFLTDPIEGLENISVDPYNAFPANSRVIPISIPIEGQLFSTQKAQSQPNKKELKELRAKSEDKGLVLRVIKINEL